MTLPDFLVLGAQRAGTTLLHRILAAHPDIFVPNRRKEIHYFDRYFDRGVPWYQAFFPATEQACRYRAIGEVTPDYLFEREVPGHIHDLLPACRFIVSLRHPVARAYSAYLHAVRSYNEPRDPGRFFSEERATLERGLYSEQLARYFELFPRSAFLLLVYEELVADPAGQLARVATFLGVDRGWDEPGALLRERVNASEIPRFGAAFARARRFGALLTRHDLDWIVRLAKDSGISKLFGRKGTDRQLPEPTRRMLEAFYRDEITTLEPILGHDLRRWWGNLGPAARADPRPTSIEPPHSGP
jgi:Sulfotransferase domain